VVGLSANGMSRIIIILIVLDTSGRMAGRFFEQGDRAGSEGRPNQRVALVVGNGGYPHAHLANAPTDARLITSALASIGFSTELLLDASRTVLETAIVRLGERMEAAGPGAFGFFYFAGHGVQHSGVNFILPVDADLPDVRYLRSSAVTVDLVIDEIDRRRHAAAAVVALDACRDNRVPDNSGGALRGLASMRGVPAGTIVAFATAADQVAEDGAGANSPFATALSKRLLEPGCRLDEVFFKVARDVATATGGIQQPSFFVQGAVPQIVLCRDDAAPAEAAEDAAVAAPPAIRDADSTQLRPAPPRRFTLLQPAPLLRPRWKTDQLRLRLAAGAGLVLLLAAGGLSYWLMRPPPSATVATNVTVVNGGRLHIQRLFLAPDGDAVWGVDRLGQGTLPNGLGIRLPVADARGCRFKVRATYSGKPDDIRTGLDLCAMPEVVFADN